MSLLLAAAPSIVSQRFIHLKRSGLPILRICRQIYLEAHPICAASGIPYFANAGELAGFLICIGPTGRLQLEAFRIGSLVSQESFEKGHEIRYNWDPYIFYLDSNDDISSRYKKMDPDVKSAFNLLIECKNLHTIYTEMNQGEEIIHYSILRTFIDGIYPELPGWDLHYWFVHRSKWQACYDGVPFFVSPRNVYRALVFSGRPMGCDVLVMVDMRLPPFPKPCPETRLGKLPQKIRTQIYHELVAPPSMHAGQGSITRAIRAAKQDAHGPLTPPATFVHLQASCLKVLNTCRQMYVEAHPIFSSRGSYYTHSTKELEFLGFFTVRTFSQPLFRRATIRSATVTALCVRNLVSWSTEKGYYLSDMAFMSVYELRKWKTLQKLCLCIRAGEEIGYLECLFLLPRMSQGVVEFMDNSHWVIRRQCPQEEWQIQYACFETNIMSYRRGKGDVVLSLEDIEVQRRILMVDSAASGLNQGDERHVEVDIGGTSKVRMPVGMKELIEKFERLSLER